ncbi:hypothetical protein R1sor_002719 [Riccia sorocarpa]|uniref:Reverse transcriptase zinc-binding domain-containing protein n=1 Tax=Riccia sorocarpa TaxID=122646 RepID=A0ABD3H2P2_9MARC
MGRSMTADFQHLERGARQGRLKTLQDLRSDSSSLEFSRLVGWNWADVQNPEVKSWLENVKVEDRKLSGIPGWKWTRGCFCTGSKAAQWGIAEGWCPWCNQEQETLVHLLWTCRRIHGRVDWIKDTLAALGDRPGTLLQVIDLALRKHNTQPSVLILLGEHCKVCWTERNKFIFDQQTFFAAPQQILAITEDNCKAVWRKARGDHADRVKSKDMDFMDTARNCWRERRARQGRVEALLRAAAREESGDASTRSEHTSHDEGSSSVDSSASESESSSDSGTSYSSSQ